MRRYLAVYKEFLANAFAEATSYRLHFFLLIIMDQIFYLSLLGGIDFIFNSVDQIGAWHRQQFLFFTAFMLAIDHLHMTFISESFWNFSFDIRTGRLDFSLLRPLNTLFTVFCRHIRPATMLNGFVPWGILIYFGMELDFVWLQWLLLPALVLLGLLLLVLMEILISVLMFWTVEAFGINFLRMQLQTVSRYPDFIYSSFPRRLFSFVLPVLLVGSAPVRFLYDFSDWHGMAFMLAGICIFAGLVSVVWKWALRYYESASS